MNLKWNKFETKKRLPISNNTTRLPYAIINIKYPIYLHLKLEQYLISVRRKLL